MPYVITTTTPTVLTRSGACIERTARKAHDCAGDGRATPNHADGCPSPQSIQPGSRYVEYIGESGLYQSGSAHSMPCAAAYGYLPTVSRVAVATLDETRSAVRKFVRERHGQSIARSVAGWVAGLGSDGGTFSLPDGTTITVEQVTTDVLYERLPHEYIADLPTGVTMDDDVMRDAVLAAFNAAQESGVSA